MVTDLDIFLNNLIEKRPEAVSQLLSEFVEDTEPTRENLKIAYLLHGENFINKLLALSEEANVEVPEFDSFLGMNIFGKNSSPDQKKEKLTKFFNTGIVAADLLKSYKENRKKLPEEDPGYKITTGKPQEEPEEKILGIDKPVFIGISVIVAIGILFTVIALTRK